MTSQMVELETIRKAAGMTIVEFTDVLPVYRSTYYGWLKEMHDPDPFRIEVCLDYADLIKDCTSAGLFPIEGVKRGARTGEIQSRLKKLA